MGNKTGDGRRCCVGRQSGIGDITAIKICPSVEIWWHRLIRRGRGLLTGVRTRCRTEQERVALRTDHIVETAHCVGSRTADRGCRDRVDDAVKLLDRRTITGGNGSFARTEDQRTTDTVIIADAGGLIVLDRHRADKPQINLAVTWSRTSEPIYFTGTGQEAFGIKTTAVRRAHPVVKIKRRRTRHHRLYVYPAAIGAQLKMDELKKLNGRYASILSLAQATRNLCIRRNRMDCSGQLIPDTLLRRFS